MAIQTFGDYARWHIHAIVADVLFTSGGFFHVMSKISLTPLADIFKIADYGIVGDVRKVVFAIIDELKSLKL